LIPEETTATLVVAGLLTVSSVAAAILVIQLIGPARTATTPTWNLLCSLRYSLAGALAFGLLETVARVRRRKLGAYGRRLGDVTSRSL
jgi:hypothetical protein